MKTLLLFLAVPASFAAYFVLVRQGIFQKTAWPHFLVALLAIAGLALSTATSPGVWKIGALAVAVVLTGFMAWWMFSYSNYSDAPLAETGKMLPLDATPGFAGALAGRDRTEVVFYRGHW